MSQEHESKIQLQINNVEELYNSSRISTEKKLNKISKQLEALDMIVRKVNKKKEKGKDVKGFDKVCLIWPSLLNKTAYCSRSLLLQQQAYINIPTTNNIHYMLCYVYIYHVFFGQRLSKIEAKISHFPRQLEENDKMLEDIIAKIINIESSKCDYVPSSSTAIILYNAKETLKGRI